MNTASIRLYDIFRKNLKLQENEARELVGVIQDIAKTEQADKHEHLEQMTQKDIQVLNDRMTKEFGYMKSYIDNTFATREDLAKDLAGLRGELSRTIYLTSLGQLIAIIASVISLVLILKK